MKIEIFISKSKYFNKRNMLNMSYLLSTEAGEQMIKKELQTAALFEKTMFEIFMYMDISVLFICVMFGFLFAVIYDILCQIRLY